MVERRRRIHACHMRRRIEPHIIIHDLSSAALAAVDVEAQCGV
jgi:hypothetical protein